MEMTNEVKIISMLGEMNNKISDINMDIKGIKETMVKNFGLIVDSQLDTNNKLNNIVESLEKLKFRQSVTEAGVGLNANRIKEISNIG